MKIQWSAPLGRVFGIRLQMHFTFLVLLAFGVCVGWLEGGPSTALLFVGLILMLFACVVLHELGHCLTARYFGIHTERILLLPIGGMAQFSSMPRQPHKELLITAAGPAVNFLIVFLLLPFVPVPDPLFYPRTLPQTLLAFNMIMGLFNLLPIFPMDGGRILRALLAIRLSYLNSTRWAVWVAKPLAVIGMVVGMFVFDRPLLAALFAFIFIGGEIEYSQVKRHEVLRGLSVRDITRHLITMLPKASTVNEATATLRESQPQPILVMGDDGNLRGLLRPEDVFRQEALGRGERTLDEITLEHPRVLQADWPLEYFGETLLRSNDELIPVYSKSKLIGVVDTRYFRERLYADLFSERLRGGKPHITNIHGNT